MEIQRKFRFKKRMMLYLMFVAMLVAFICVGIYYTFSSQSFLDYMIEMNSLAVKNQVYVLDNQLEQLDSFIITLFVNNDLRSLLRRDASQVDTFDSVKQNVYAGLTSQFNFLPITEYIAFFQVRGENGLSIRKGYQAYLVDTDDYQGDGWYQQAQSSSGDLIIGHAVRNYTSIPSKTDTPALAYVLPVFKYFNNGETRRKEGELILLLSTDILFRIDPEELDPRQIQQMLCDERGNVLFGNRPEDIGTTCDEQVMAIIQEQQSGALLFKNGSSNQILSFERTQHGRYYLVRMVSLDQWSWNWPVISTALITIVISAGFTVVFSMIISSTFSRPVQRLVDKVNAIAKDIYHSVRSDQSPKCMELAILDKSIDLMQENTVTLIRRSLQEEEEKRAIELQMLQMQINPHFLHNTLNTIRWMSVLQGAEGIKVMVTALSELLYLSYSDYSAEISLEKELQILDRYITIQEAKYSDRLCFSVDIASPELLQCRILKFTLQPIVENCIFHGIEPKMSGEGMVAIRVEEKEGKLHITIRDNGVGMSEKAVEELLQAREENARHGIGIWNVHRRIRLHFGPEYGIKVSSVLGEFTEVTLTLPLCG